MTTYFFRYWCYTSECAIVEWNRNPWHVYYIFYLLLKVLVGA